MVNQELYHYGIKGMKWGVRRTPVQLGYKKKGRIRSKEDLKTKPKTVQKTQSKTKPQSEPVQKPKTAKEMSDDELRRAINRIELEKQYNRLVPKEVSRGRQIADRVINNMVIPAAEDVGRQLIKTQMTKIINQKLGLSDEYKIYTNNKKK